MLTEDFCTYLEYQISRTLANSADPVTSHFWCDGVLLPDSEEAYSPRQVNNTRQVLTRAWIDDSGNKGPGHGQFLFQLRIRFGKKAVRYYMRGNDLKECVPSTENDNWIMLDVESRLVEIQLL